MAANSWTKPFNQIVGAASSYYNGHPNNKPSHSNYQHIPNPSYSQSTPLQPSTAGQYAKPQSGTLSRHRKTYETSRRYLKIVTTFSLVVSSLLTLFMEASMIYILYKWLRTRHTPASDYSRTSPWAKNSVVWPTYMLLASSAITFLLCLAMLIAKCCRSRKKATFSLVYNVTHVVVWAVVMVLYRLFKTEKDLWGWSCSQKAEGIQDLYQGVVQFGSLCQIQVMSDELAYRMWMLTIEQTSDWQASIAETGIKVLCAAVGWYLKRKGSCVRKIIVDQIGDAGIEDFS